jgi:tetratricopeptide (TPR) repeat protein
MTRHRIAQILLTIGASLAPVVADAQCVPAVQRLISTHKYDEARTELQAQLTRAPNDDMAMHCMGRLLLDQDESGEAVDWLDKAVKLNDKSAQHHMWFGLALRTEGGKAGMVRGPMLYGRMMTELEKSLALDPTLIDSRYALLQVLASAPAAMGGSMTKAREHAAEIAKLNPMRGHLGFGLVAEQEKDFTTAEKEFLAAISVKADSDAAYSVAGAFYRRRERWADAIGMYEKQLKAMPKDATPGKVSNAHYYLGIAHDKNGHGDKAKTEYQLAIAANPKNEGAKKALASLPQH